MVKKVVWMRGLESATSAPEPIEIQGEKGRKVRIFSEKSYMTRVPPGSK